MRKQTYLLWALVIVLSTTNVVLADLSDGLVAYYPFNGNANDTSGNGLNGTVSGAILTTGYNFSH